MHLLRGGKISIVFNKNSSLCLDAPLGLLCSVCKKPHCRENSPEGFKTANSATDTVCQIILWTRNILRFLWKKNRLRNIIIQTGPHIELPHFQMNLIQLCPSLSNTQGYSRSSVSHLNSARSPAAHKSCASLPLLSSAWSFTFRPRWWWYQPLFIAAC